MDLKQNEEQLKSFWRLLSARKKDFGSPNSCHRYAQKCLQSPTVVSDRHGGLGSWQKRRIGRADVGRNLSGQTRVMGLRDKHTVRYHERLGLVRMPEIAIGAT